MLLMSDERDRNQNMCHLEFDPGVVGVKPATSLEKVALGLLILQDASLDDLVNSSGLTSNQVLKQIKTLRRDYGVSGNKRTGYELSADPMERVSMCALVEKLSEERTVRR